MKNDNLKFKFLNTRLIFIFEFYIVIFNFEILILHY